MLRILASMAPSTAGVDVGVLEDEERGVAAELHRHPQQLLGGLLDELRPTAVEPVKVSLRSRGSRMSGSHTSPVVRRGDDVEHAVGQPALLQHLGEGEHGQRRLAGPA